MPTFYTEDIDVSVDEFLNACSSREIEELIEEMIEREYINKKAKAKSYEPYSISEAQFQEALDKLDGKWNMLTEEEEQAVIKISSRF